MRTPTIIFATGFLLYLVTSLFFNPEFDFRMRFLRGASQPVTEAREYLANPADVVGAPVAERTISGLGFVERVEINPGVRLVHDPSLGRDVVLRGPQAMLDAFVDRGDGGRFAPDLLRPVRTDRHLEVRINLRAHGSDYLRIALQQPRPGSTNFPPDFRSEGTLTFAKIALHDFRDVPAIEIAARETYIGQNSDAALVTGRTDLLRLGASKDEVKLSDKLEYREARFPQRRDTDND